MKKTKKPARKSPAIWIVYSTFPDAQTAQAVARQLIEKKLVACVNIGRDVKSVYLWKGKVEEASEVMLVAKTTRLNAEKTITAIKHLHSYEVPCIIAYPVGKGHKPFLQWVSDETHET